MDYFRDRIPVWVVSVTCIYYVCDARYRRDLGLSLYFTLHKLTVTKQNLIFFSKKSIQNNTHIIKIYFPQTARMKAEKDRQKNTVPHLRFCSIGKAVNQHIVHINIHIFFNSKERKRNKNGI